MIKKKKMPLKLYKTLAKVIVVFESEKRIPILTFDLREIYDDFSLEVLLDTISEIKHPERIY